MPDWTTADGLSHIGEEIFTANKDIVNETVGFIPNTDTVERTEETAQDRLLNLRRPLTRLLHDFSSNDRIAWIQVISALAHYCKILYPYTDS